MNKIFCISFINFSRLILYIYTIYTYLVFFTLTLYYYSIILLFMLHCLSVTINLKILSNPLIISLLNTSHSCLASDPAFRSKQVLTALLYFFLCLPSCLLADQAVKLELQIQIISVIRHTSRATH